MNPAPATHLPPNPPAVPAVPAAPTPAASAWPGPAQGATVFLLVLAAVLLAMRGAAGLRWQARPLDLSRPAGPGQLLDLNRADRVELLQLPGIGPALADQILAHRAAHGPFRRVDDLRKVHGIGPSILDRIRPWLRVGPDEPDGDPDESPDDPPVARPAERTYTPSRPAADQAPARPARPAGRKELPAEPINVNRASAEELQRLPGIGPVIAGRIVAARQQALFQRVEDLRRVKGIGVVTWERLRPHVTTDPPPSAGERGVSTP